MKIKFKKHKKIIILMVVAIVLVSVSGVFALNGYFGGGASIPEDTMTRGLVGYWNFDEGSGQTAYNAASTGAVNDGTLGSSASADSADPKWTTGHAVSGGRHGVSSGSALSFDGDNDYVNAGNDPSLNITDAITIEAWVKTTDTKAIQFIAGHGNTGYEGWFFAIDSGNFVRLQVANGTVTKSASRTYSTGSWSNVVGIYDGSNIVVYVNGVAGTPTAHTGAIDYTGEPYTWIGQIEGSGDDPKRFFNGSIDSVRIYNRALSAEEVRYHYNRGGPVAQLEI